MSVTRLILTEKGKALQKELLKDMPSDEIPNYQSFKTSRIITLDDNQLNTCEYEEEEEERELPPDRTGYFRPKEKNNSLPTIKHKVKPIYPLYLRKEDDYPPRHICEFREKSTTTTEKMKLQKPKFKITHHTNFQGSLIPTKIPLTISINNNDGLDGTNLNTSPDSFLQSPGSTQRLMTKESNHFMPSILSSHSEGKLDNLGMQMKSGDTSLYGTLPKLKEFGNAFEKITNHPNSPLGTQSDAKNLTHTTFKNSVSFNTTNSINSLSMNRIIQHYDPVKLSRIIDKSEKTKKHFQYILEELDKKTSLNNIGMDNNVVKRQDFLNQLKQEYNILKLHEVNKQMEKEHYHKKVKELQKKKYEVLWAKFHFPNKNKTNNQSINLSQRNSLAQT